MIHRDIKEELLRGSSEYPVVTVLGPRQSGKTTLVRRVFPEMPYFSLEDPDTRAAAEADPRGFLNQAKSGCILDEVQRFPDLLSYIQGIVDNSSARYILTGSHQPLLHEAISQSLAGRTAMLTLWPFSISELRSYKKDWNPFELIVRGGFPRLHDESLDPRRFFNNYLQTYIERDVRTLIQLRDLKQFQIFLTLLAGRVGQLLNLTSFSNDVGVSSTTIRNWLNVLKASYLVLELSPYFGNIRKRQIKSSKLYFTDVGLASYLLGIHTEEQASRDPLRGHLYENLVISEVIKGALNCGLRPEVYFYRASHGKEVDLIIRENGKLTPVEIKSSSTFSGSFVKSIEHFHGVLPGQTIPGAVLYTGEMSLELRGTRVFNPLSVDNIWEHLTGMGN